MNQIVKNPKMIGYLFIGFLLLCFSCNYSVEKGASKADLAFKILSEDYIKAYFDAAPEKAVWYGFHEYDGKSSDYSQSSIEEKLTMLKNFDRKFSSIDTSTLSTQNYYDWKIVCSHIKKEIFSIDDLKVFSRNPIFYTEAVSIVNYIQCDFAPIEQRIESIIAIEKKIPKLFEDAKANLQDTLAIPHIKTAIAIAKAKASFLENDLLLELKEVKNDSLMELFTKTNNAAIKSINDYIIFLENKRLPIANNDYALGIDNYQKMLLYDEGISMSADSILAIGIKELKKEQEAFKMAAKIISPDKQAIEVYADIKNEHPTANNLLPFIKNNLDTIRQFIMAKEIVTMPSEINLKVQETPNFLRAMGFFAYLNGPGPFETKATESYYYITPVKSTWPPEQQEDWLKFFNYYFTDIISIHEIYPGHYTHVLHLISTDASKLRKIFWSYAYIEGWAHYAEQMMIDEGFRNTDNTIRDAKYRMAQSFGSLLRICRLCVSIKMHCHGMDIDEATQFFIDNSYLGDLPSKNEALRGTHDPGYLYYTLGKLQILKLREDYKKQEGENYSLKKFNDAMLDNGMPPVQIMRELLLHDKEIWSDIL